MKLLSYIMIILFAVIALFLSYTFLDSMVLDEYELGDTFNHGTIIYFLISTDDGYEEDKNNAMLVYDNTKLIQWGCRGQLVNTTLTAFGTGLNNTLEIIDFHDGIDWTTCNAGNDETVAAEEAYFREYHLPSLEELRIVWLNRGYATIPELDYWTSSEYSDTQAWVGDFTGGVTKWILKDNSDTYVLPIAIMDIPAKSTTLSVLAYIGPLLIMAIVFIGLKGFFKGGR